MSQNSENVFSGSGQFLIEERSCLQWLCLILLEIKGPKMPPDEAAEASPSRNLENKYLGSVNIDRAESLSSEIVHPEIKKKWVSYIWDTLDKSPAERRFLFKLDAALLSFASLGYFIKYLDQVNINNAFVSGMKEDLGLFGNQLNYMQTCWTVGYVVGQIPRYG